ncbi:winged helix-turn-helix transcriptional regulator [Halomicroarcula sp. GCM10025709]|uniref:winged helix-turn-helix transcriptional regulator n=1 Tax=Haloarcula TaxID=2237 RepID=UPI0024C449AF|nr:helix-turn-helix domain-containing protein [Halomicroarcula sp. YJ-61-S]
MTAESDRRQASIEAHNARACPVVTTIEEIGTPWRLNVLYALGDGEQRFNDLKRATDARSKTLSDALDALVDADIVERRMEAAAPVAVYYSLSQKGEELVPVLDRLSDWATRWGRSVPDDASGRIHEP